MAAEIAVVVGNHQGERLLGAAEHILEGNPSPELSADIDLAYSSLSYMLDKPELAADYAARGLHVLGLRPALPIRVRLLADKAPKHASTVVYLTLMGFYDGLTLHKVTPGKVVDWVRPVT